MEAQSVASLDDDLPGLPTVLERQGGGVAQGSRKQPFLAFRNEAANCRGDSGFHFERVRNVEQKMHGPGVYVDIPKEVMAGQSAPGSGWGKSSQEEQSRRSIYIHVKRSLITPILESFDVAETDRSAPVRFATVQPTQALSMFNGDFLEGQSKQFAARLRRECGNDPVSQVRRAFLLAAGRIPSDTELQRGTSLIESLVRVDGMTPDASLQQFCLLVLNLNEMVFLD